MIDERIHDSVGSAVQARLDELFEETDNLRPLQPPNEYHQTRLGVKREKAIESGLPI